MYRNRKQYAYTSTRELRRVFWDTFPQLNRTKVGPPSHRHYTTDTRCTFVDWLDGLHRDGMVSDRLANNATL